MSLRQTRYGSVEPLLKQEVQTQLEKSLDVNLKELIRNGSIKDLDPAKLKVMAKNLHLSNWVHVHQFYRTLFNWSLEIIIS